MRTNSLQPCDESGHSPARPAWWCSLLVLCLTGCGREGSTVLLDIDQGSTAGPGQPANSLQVVTTWSRASCQRLEKDFQDWISQLPAPERPAVADLVFHDRNSGRFGGRALRIPTSADVLLGGPLVDFVRLERLGMLAEPAAGNASGSPIHVLPGRAVVLFGGTPTAFQPVGFDDPRVEPAMLSWCMSRLVESGWREGYRQLIRLAGRSPGPVGWRRGSALASLGRHETTHAVVIVDGSDLERYAESLATPLPEVVAILGGSPKAALSRLFLRFLIERHDAAPLAVEATPDPEVRGLVADLLGATMVDSLEELQAAWQALGGVDSASPSPALSWMTEPPPWPPASVEKLIYRDGDRGLAMAQDLAGQLAPDPELRFWLIQSWLRTPRLVDEALLKELAQAVRGRLVREDRFRSWLRTEWTAWARQRYRRVARLATGAVPAQAVNVEPAGR